MEYFLKMVPEGILLERSSPGFDPMEEMVLLLLMLVFALLFSSEEPRQPFTEASPDTAGVLKPTEMPRHLDSCCIEASVTYWG